MFRKKTSTSLPPVPVEVLILCCLSHPAMILAGKAYYDGVAKIGEIAAGSPVSTELGELTFCHAEPQLLAHEP